MHIAILEDDEEISTHLSLIVRRGGHQCLVFPTGKSLMASFPGALYDLLILDWNLPDITGIEVLQWIRANLEGSLPVIFVTSRDREEDVVTALDLGGDDYIVKPVQDRELLARIAAVFRRSSPRRQSDILFFGKHRFDVKRCTVSIAEGEPISLTSKEFALALLLFQNLDRPLSRTYIMEKEWGRNADVMTRTLDAHVSRIRLKLRLRPEFGYRLASLHSFGYRLETIVEERAG